MLFLIETALTLLVLAAALMRPSSLFSWFARVEIAFNGLARRRGLAVLVVGGFTLFLRLALLPILPIPEPIVHDEFGYLLAADTFAHGRITNPSHPLWPHFETFSILQRPTYQCYAQPAQGIVLAFGKLLGHPFWGVWLCTGLMCAAITWMLQAWLPPRWALLGGVMAVLRFGAFSYWANSYWGGAVAAIGGALVLGSLPRIKAFLQVRHAISMGLGLMVLANSRPYEGFILSLPVAVALIIWMLGKHTAEYRVLLRRLVLPLAVMLMLTAAGLGYYFWRVTGSPYRMPYEIERQTYAVAPYMIWKKPNPEPHYNHAVIRKLYVDQEYLEGYQYARTAAGLVMKSVWAWGFYLGPVLSFPMFMMGITLPYGLTWRDINPRMRFFLFTALVAVIGLALETFFHPHYAAPFSCLVIVLVLSAMRELTRWRWRGRRTGLALVRGIIVICVAMFTIRMLAVPLHLPITIGYTASWDEASVPSFGRAKLQSQLAQLPGKQLVIVTYSDQHSPFYEWVYNDADIDSSKVVWARGMGAEKDAELINYYHDRKVWLWEPDASPPRLIRYVAPTNGIRDADIGQRRQRKEEIQSP